MERPPLKVTISAIQRISQQSRVPVEVLKFNNKKLLALFAICLKAKCLFSVRNLSKTGTIQVDDGQCLNEK